MKHDKNIFLVLASVGMALCCFYAWTSFIFGCLSRKPISLSEGAVIFLLAMLITFLHHQRGWRRIQFIGLHLSGFLFASLWLIHRYYEMTLPFWRIGWIQEFQLLEQGVAKWPFLALILVCVWLLWFMGIRMVTKPTNKAVMSYRFDAGLGFILLLLFIKLLVVVKGASIPVEYSYVKLIIAYIILGLFSMGFVHFSSPPRSGGISYVKGGGVILSFVLSTLMLGGGLFILFLPELEMFAETSAGLIKTATAPLGPIIVAILRFVLVSGCRGHFREETMPEGAPSIPEPGEGGWFFGIIVAYFMAGLMVVFCLSVIGLALLYLFKWLRTRTVGKETQGGIWWALVVMGIRAVRRFFTILRTKMYTHTDSFFVAEAIYRRLLRWGTLSGLHFAPSETPQEYGVRLGKRFPRIEEEIRTIIRIHDAVVYGDVNPESPQISHAKRALRRIRHPFLWFARFKSLCFDNRN